MSDLETMATQDAELYESQQKQSSRLLYELNAEVIFLCLPVRKKRNYAKLLIIFAKIVKWIENCQIKLSRVFDQHDLFLLRNPVLSIIPTKPVLRYFLLGKLSNRW